MRILASSTLVLAAVLPRFALAYEVKQTEGGDPVRWEDPEIEVALDLRAQPDAIPTSKAEKAVERAFATYEDLLGASVVLSSALGPELETGPEDRVNVVRWITAGDDDDMDPSALAVTRTTYYTDNGSIVDADIVINADQYHWTTEVTEACEGVFDVENIIAHEVGHFFGLGHSDDRDATMYPTSGRCETEKRDLSDDDVAGLEVLYETRFSAADPAPGGGEHEGSGGGCSMQMSIGGGSGGLWTALVIAFAIAVARRRGSRLVAAVAVAAGVASVAMSAWAGMAREMPIEDLGRASSVVVRGDVVETRSFRDGDRVYTDTVVSVRECWKTGAACPAELTVRQLGGEADGLGMAVEGSASLAVGSEAVLFLRARRDGALAPVGMAQGVFVARQDAAGRVRYVRDLRGLDLVREDHLRAGSVEMWNLSSLHTSMSVIEND